MRSRFHFPLGPTSSVTSSSNSSDSTPSPTFTLRASNPSLAAPTSCPSASCTRSGSTISSRVASATGTLLCTAVPPSILADRPSRSHQERTSREGPPSPRSSTRTGTSSVSGAGVRSRTGSQLAIRPVLLRRWPGSAIAGRVSRFWLSRGVRRADDRPGRLACSPCSSSGIVDPAPRCAVSVLGTDSGANFAVQPTADRATSALPLTCCGPG